MAANCISGLLVYLIYLNVCIGQTLKLKAIYYDEKNIPYKIEEKYENANTNLYLRHNNENSVFVREETTRHSDTVLIKTAYGIIVHEKSNLEKLSQSNTWMTSTSETGDTVTLTGYESFPGFDPVTTGDTILTGAIAKDYFEFTRQIKYARIPWMVENNIRIKTDSLFIQEIIYAYYVKGLLVIADDFNQYNYQHLHEEGMWSDHQLIWKSYFTDNGPVLFQTDTTTWNSDTSKITCHSVRIDDLDWDSKTEYSANINSLDIQFRDSTIMHMKYDNIRQNSLLKFLIDDWYVYNDLLYAIDLHKSDRARNISTVSSDDNKYEYQFDIDKAGKLVTQNCLKNGLFYYKVFYSEEE
jgi:hypothetical protein